MNRGGALDLKIKFEDSVATDLLQLADLVAGAVNRSLQPDKTDAQRYIEIFRGKIVKLKKLTSG